MYYIYNTKEKGRQIAASGIDFWSFCFKTKGRSVCLDTYFETHNKPQQHIRAIIES